MSRLAASHNKVSQINWLERWDSVFRNSSNEIRLKVIDGVVDAACDVWIVFLADQQKVS